jgi:methionyl-tRNA formyltransferase
MAYGHILKKMFLEVSPGGCFNLHASLLPKYRGASPIETAIAMGETLSGVTLMRVVQKMDAGPIVDSESVKIDSLDTGSTLRGKIAQSCVPLIQRNIEALVKGSANEIVQEEESSTYCRKLFKEDGNLNFSIPAKTLVNRVRAFQFWPGCVFSLRGEIFRIGLAEAKKNDLLLEAGETTRDEGGNFLIGTSEGALCLLKLQKPGGKMLKIEDFLRGFNFPFGEIIESLEMKNLLLCEK